VFSLWQQGQQKEKEGRSLAKEDRSKRSSFSARKGKKGEFCTLWLRGERKKHTWSLEDGKGTALCR